jgi:hypothetical protein
MTLARLEDMEGHFSVVWSNFGPEVEFNIKILADRKFLWTSKNPIFQNFNKIVNPG